MVEITEYGMKNLTRILNRKYPGRKSLRITNLKEITEGWETIIYSFTLYYEVNDESFTEDLVVRFFQGPHQREQAIREFSVMKNVNQWGIPVPRVEILVTKSSPFRHPFIIMEKVNGETLGNVLIGAQENEILLLMKLMVSQFVKLHQIPWQEVFKANKYTRLIKNGPLAYVKSKLFDMRSVVNRYALRQFEPFLYWLAKRKDLGATHRLSVMHNDYHPQNLLLRENGGSLAIIDWSFADIGDYRLDLAWSVLLFGVTVDQHYRGIMVKAYEDIAGTSVDNFEYFEVLKFTERMLTIATWLDESVEIPVKKITREAIRKEYKIHVLNVYNRLKEITGLKLPLIENL